MATSLNEVKLIGNVGKDPDIRTTQDGKEVASFSLATSEVWTDKTSGERKEKTEWHKIVVFAARLIPIIKSYVKKGTRLYICGSLHTRKWVDQSNGEKYVTEVVLQSSDSKLLILSTKDDNENIHTNTMHSKADDDDDIPF
jgi:single-strand DNA-binding protein